MDNKNGVFYRLSFKDKTAIASPDQPVQPGTTATMTPVGQDSVEGTECSVFKWFQGLDVAMTGTQSWGAPR